MATTTKARKRSPATAPTIIAEPVETPRLGGGRVGSIRALADRLPRFALADRFQREVLGVVLLFGAGLSAWALVRGAQDGFLVVWWRDVLVSAYGVAGGWLVPVFLAMVAIRVLREHGEPILRPHHYVGGFALAIAGLGLLDLAVGTDGFRPGGNLGRGVSTVVEDVLGDVAAGVALYLIGTIAVFLLARMSAVRFVNEVRTLLPARRGSATGDADFERWPDHGADADDLIGLDAGDGLASGASGRFQRRRDDLPGAAPIPGNTGPIRSVGEIDHDLEILTPPRRRGRGATPGTVQPDPVAHLRLPTAAGPGASTVGARGASSDLSASASRLAPGIRVTVPDRPSPATAGARTATGTRPAVGAGSTARPVMATSTTADAPAAPAGQATGSSRRLRRAPALSQATPVYGEAVPADDAAEPFDDALNARPAITVDALTEDDDTDEPFPVQAPARPVDRPATPPVAGSVAVRRDPVITAPHRQAPIVEPIPVVESVAAPTPLRRAAIGEPMPLPDVAQLPYYETHKPNTGELEAKARTIQEKLASFRVQAWVREINTGPSVTQFALEPGEGVKVRRITELQNDLALALSAPQIRIEAPVPGQARVGIEVPNDQIMTVGLRETLESAAFLKGKQKLPIPLGLDVNGKYIVGDLAKMPHLLIAGATGSGKSVCINGIISTFLLTRQPDEVKLLLIDPKMVELTGYNGVPHLQCPVVTEMGKVVPALRLVLREMERRYTLFSTLGVRNLDGYRLKTADEPGAEKLPYLVVVIDELADLMMTTPVEVESLLQRLTQMARATGIHLILATQRPSVDVITGVIKSNVPARIAFMVSSGTDSKVILDTPGAERLLGKGDMLYVPPDAAKPQRIQGVFVADEDVPRLVAHWHSVVPVPQYAQEWIDLPTVSDDSGSGGGGLDDDIDDDPLWDQAIEIVRKQGTASASMLQRRLRIGYNRAARLIQEMEDQNIIGPADGIRGRTVYLTDESA